MKRITDFIVKKRNIIIVLFIFWAILSVFLAKKVKVNYDMAEYLPKNSETRIGMNIMNEEFEEEAKSNLNIMFKNLNDDEKISIYEKLINVEGVSSVDFDKESEEYNINEYSLYVVNVDDTEDSETSVKIYNTVKNEFKDYEFYESGSIADRNTVILPMWLIILAVSICTLILIIMCESYIEPFLFLACIGIAVLLNNGSNIIFGTVSNITSSISAILQLALSMDYSIMLINRYKQEKENNINKVEAMKEALYKSFSSISSSSITTIVGLVVLVFMSFTIGRDLGLVLAKGVLFSLLVIFTCLPALILMFDKLIVKTKKKSLNITLNKFGGAIYKVRAIGAILLVILFIGSYILKGNLGMLYTASEQDKIAEIFKPNNQLAIIYNNNDEEKVANYLNEIENVDNVKEVLAYGNTINEKLKYNEFNNKLAELDSDTKIDEYLLKILYYEYNNQSEERKMTFDEFVDFTQNNVLPNENFSSKLEENTESNIKRLRNFTSPSEINKKRAYSEIANILEMDKNDCYNLFVYYYSDKVNIKLTVTEFVNFVNNEVLTNSDYSKSISESQKESINTLSKFLNKNTITKNMNSTEMAKLYGLNKNTVDDIYLYYYSVNGVDTKLSVNEFANFVLENVVTDVKYKNKFNENTIQNLKLLQTMSNKSIIEKSMNSKELSELFGIEEEKITKLLLLKYLTIDNNTAITISEFIDFINYLKENTNYLDGVDVSKINKISMFAKNENNVNTSKMNKIQLSYIFNNISEGFVDKVYFALKLPSEYETSPKEFIDITLKNLSGNLDETLVKNLNLIKSVMDASINKSKFNSSEISKMLGIDKMQAVKIFTLYDYTKGNTANWKETPYKFIELIFANSQNEEISLNIEKESMEKLQYVYGIMQSSKNNQKYSYTDIAKFVGMDVTLSKSIYALYSAKNEELKISPVNFAKFLINHKNDEMLKGKVNRDTESKLIMLDSVMDGVIKNKEYTVNEMANLLSLNKEDVKLLYSLYSAKHINGNMCSSLNEFIKFILEDVVTNEKYSKKITDDKRVKLITVNGIMNSSINNAEFTPGEIFTVLSQLSDNVEKNTIELLYIYYGSEKHYDENWTITIEEFINYINDKILEDSRFEDFIDEDMKKQVTDAKDTINENKKKLVGNKYSRIVVNTKLDMESNETHEFIQKIYDNLERTESYIIGDSPMAYEMSKSFEGEFNFISILTMVAIFIVVAITFKSLVTPTILVLIIQCAVYMTMGILGMIGENVYFISLLIVQSILMGATIDYAILYTSYYIESRKTLNVKEAVKNAYNKSIHTILTSSSILILATFLVGKYASAIAAKICKTLSEGVLCSTILILIILPATIAVFDKFIVKGNKKKK